MLLELKNVTKEYKGSNFKLEDISFSVDKKEVIGLIGKNGCGKSTILKMINKLVDYDSGEILYEGKKIHEMNEKELRSLRKSIVYIFQNANLIENRSVYYHLSLIYKLNKEKVNEDKIDEILEFMEITRLKHSYCKHLSGGQKQKVAIAMAILQEPNILLCDEISSALDVKAEKEIYELLEKIKKKSDIAIIMISHNLSVLKNFCEKILFIDDNVIKDVIHPKKGSYSIQKDYNEYVLEFLND